MLRAIDTQPLPMPRNNGCLASRITVRARAISTPKIIDSAAVIAEAYATGRGGFRVRSRWHVEDQGRGTWVAVVTEIPYQVQKGKLIEAIAAIINDKKLPILADVRDESDEAIRIVIEPRSRSVDPDVLMESLFKLSELEVRISLNMNVLDADRTPRVLSL